MKIKNKNGRVVKIVKGSSLVRADLRQANLRKANLSGADLRCANLRKADFRGANLTGTEVIPEALSEQGALFDKYTVFGDEQPG